MSGLTVLAALTRAVLDGAVTLGAERDALERAAALDPALLDDPDGRVPIDAHLRLWAAAAARPIGLALGARLGAAGLGVVGYALPHGATVGEAVDLLVRHRALVQPGAVPRVERRTASGEARFAFVQDVPAPFARLVEPVDAQAAACVALTRALVAEDVAPTRVALPRPRPDDPRAHEAFYRCDIAWDAAAIDVELDAALLDRPLPRSDPQLFGYLARRAEALAKALPEHATFAERVRREIGERLAHEEPTLRAVARRLAVSERTLHRRLAGEGTGFASLLDAARRERALVLVDDSSLSAAELASLLGYTEPSAFFRAFRRWTGETPRGYRASRRGDAAPERLE
jgi:AraC-like DNA-binding protein